MQNNSYNERFSRDIRNPRYARRYINELLYNKEEPLTLDQILRIIASKMGTTDFAGFVGEKPQNINKFIKGERYPKIETLDKFLRPFGLETVLHVKELDEDGAA